MIQTDQRRKVNSYQGGQVRNNKYIPAQSSTQKNWTNPRRNITTRINSASANTCRDLHRASSITSSHRRTNSFQEPQILPAFTPTGSCPTSLRQMLHETTPARPALLRLAPLSHETTFLDPVPPASGRWADRCWQVPQFPSERPSGSSVSHPAKTLVWQEWQTRESDKCYVFN